MSGIKTPRVHIGQSTPLEATPDIDGAAPESELSLEAPRLDASQKRAMALVDGVGKSFALPGVRGNGPKPLTPRADMSEEVAKLIERAQSRDLPAGLPALLNDWTSARVWS